jgi:lipocalin
MKDKELQDLEPTKNVSVKRDMKSKKKEMPDESNIQAVQDDDKTTTSENPSAENEIHPDDANKSIVETEQLINDIEKDQDKKTEQDYDLMPREHLVSLLEETVRIVDLNSIKAAVALIKVAFLKKEKDENESLLKKFLDDGGKKEEYSPAPDNLTERFNIAFGIYREKKTRFNEELEKQKHHNLALKLKILDDLKHLVESEEELKRTYDAFKTLQDKWKEIGLVPKTEINNLWQNYNFLVEKFFDKVKINKELKDLDLKKNLEAKMDLCEKTEELLLETSVIRSFQQLQRYHEVWREIGPVPQDKKDEIWERFRNATEKINERRQEHYEKLKEDQEKNTETKTLLCEKAEHLAEKIINTAKDWQEQTNILNDLLKEWKTVGPAPKKQNDELWIRFKTAVDNFFNNKKEFFGKLKDEQVTNYNQKLNLCLQAEAIKLNQDWRHTTEELIRLQQEWKKIGPVPKKYSDKIWKRFRAACDEFFNAKSFYYANIDSKEEENLKLKQELIQQIKDYHFGEDNNENLRIIKEFQRKWMEIGHVPMKFKNDLHNEFRNVINQNLDKLKISPVEKNTIGFKTKFETIAHNPGSDHVIYKEKSIIITRINTLKNDIKLWENNVGFFANSKKANVLKEEFLNKIDKAKEDIKVLEEKLKFLREVK